MRRQAIEQINSATTPRILTNPVGVDVPVKVLQAKLTADLSWLEKSFDRATQMSKLENDQEVVFPICEISDTYDPVIMIGADNVRAYSFFYCPRNEDVIDYDQYQTNLYERELRLYVWVNVDTVRTFLGSLEYPDVLKEAVELSLRNTTFANNESITVDNIEDVPSEIFEGFTLDLAKTQNLYYPHKAYRFDMTVIYNGANEC